MGTRRAAVVAHRLERWRGQFENWPRRGFESRRVLSFFISLYLLFSFLSDFPICLHLSPSRRQMIVKN